MKENECKEKKIYDWCVFKGKNIDEGWEDAREPGHDDVHHTTIQEKNFNFSPFRKKLKFHIFCCLKFYFKISKI